jgi:lysozyme
MEKFLKAIISVLEALLGAFSTPHTKKTVKAPQEAAQGVSDLSLIKDFEGVRLTSYQDVVGVWTIGYGHTKTAKPGMRITMYGATELLRQDLRWVEKAIKKNVKVPLTQNQYDALASWVFNLGETNLRSSTLLKKLNAGDYTGAGQEMLRWNKAGGKVVRGLTRRREAEVALWTSNKK